jgi:hypothetical protein
LESQNGKKTSMNIGDKIKSFKLILPKDSELIEMKYISLKNIKVNINQKDGLVKTFECKLNKNEFIKDSNTVLMDINVEDLDLIFDKNVYFTIEDENFYITKNTVQRIFLEVTSIIYDRKNN